ncbi:MAG TPA: EscU/YscU/HrcU family type III secretion system export apparatus switch protein [Candidatus Eremiobacteraceae bacterium]
MSGDDERTLPPTQRRLAKARSQGNAARSAGAVAALTVTACAVVAATCGHATAWWMEIARESALHAAAAAHEDASALSRPAATLLRAAAPWSAIGCAWVCAVSATFISAGLCGGVSPSVAALRIDGDRLSWAGGAKKLATADFAGAGVALAGAAAIVFSAAAAVHAWAGIASQRFDFGADMTAFGAALADTWRRAAPIALLVGAADIVLARHRHMSGLRMTPREVKEERADNEGRPEIKARRRHAAAKRARGVRISAVRNATAVVTNPTHISIALRYCPPEIDVPVVVARGADLMASLLRGAAETYGVPIVEAPELARLLYARAEADCPIPEEAYAAVAAVFAWIMRTRGALPGAQAGLDDRESVAT